ncbi:oxygenase MpaB family protein [Hyphomonas sp.]|uniref:oxygenase MpaB family protein n=1 Tax=Hyphomonas sp. TaxID=87 RepID=UPI0025C7178C|nr:oxygenase MpaB family protein [Hyphomonas sp.]
MAPSIAQVHERIALQKSALPVMYGDVDFSATPERYTERVEESSLPKSLRHLPPPPADMVERVKAYTMLGDITADAYAALMGEYGFKRLVDMLTTACDHGIEAVPDAPKELVALIREMETKPDWLDMDLVREGARLNRLPMAVTSPWMIRGAFLATFLNKYTALPMAMTGTLGHSTASRRVNETATFFTVTTLPGALEPRGEGFKAAAMVRLMHSMVRFNILRRMKSWDKSVYGIPVPQVDQMPAGLIDVFLLAYQMLDEGRTEFTEEERARVEFSRYRCYLLGLPEDLLMDTPQGIVDIMNARGASIREGFDDETCGTLVRATLEAYLPPDRKPGHRIFNALEKRLARLVLVKHFLNGDAERARRIGVPVGPTEYAVAAVLFPYIAAKMALYRFALSVPGLCKVADRRLTARIRRLLKRYGHAEFTSDAEAYRPAVPVAA